MVNLEDYNYLLPENLVAKEPSSKRDMCRLFVYSTSENKVYFDIFKNINKYLPDKSVFVFNDTKVVPARLNLFRGDGKEVELFILINEPRANDGYLKAISNRSLKVGEILSLNGNGIFKIIRAEDRFFFVEELFDGDINSFLKNFGHTPLPPYIKGSKLSEDEARSKYQSIMAKFESSVAAPTASLHFSDEVISNLKKNGAELEYLTLHVGLGTFATISHENLENKRLFNEWLTIDRRTSDRLNKYKNEGRKIIAVGTTVTRALESSVSDGYLLSRENEPTDIFIFPPYDFQFVDCLITNFHVPKSSLMLLVDAFLKHKEAKMNILELYKIAIDDEFRFYSFGDAMLIV